MSRTSRWGGYCGEHGVSDLFLDVVCSSQSPHVSVYPAATVAFMASTLHLTLSADSDIMSPHHLWSLDT